MEITNTATLANRQPAASSKPAYNEDFETFLKMLTTQIQNQDPLSPLQADEFASQLAMFSMVEQQTLANSSLTALLSVLSDRNLGDYAGLIGRTVAHDGPVSFSGPSIEFEFGIEGTPEDAFLVLSDENGARVSEQFVPRQSLKATWDGVDSQGLPLRVGDYSVELRSATSDEVLNTPVLQTSVVEEINLAGTTVTLSLASGATIQETSVAKLRS